MGVSRTAAGVLDAGVSGHVQAEIIARVESTPARSRHPKPVRAKDGRGDWIRTSDPLLPKQMRYQAALLPV
jgi:hypothetical protein